MNSLDWNDGMERWSELLEWNTGLDYWSATPTVLAKSNLPMTKLDHIAYDHSTIKAVPDM